MTTAGEMAAFERGFVAGWEAAERKRAAEAQQEAFNRLGMMQVAQGAMQDAQKRA